MMGEKQGDYTYYVVEQFVSEVLDFSSQYGSDASISYTAHNIVGKPTRSEPSTHYYSKIYRTVPQVPVLRRLLADVCNERLRSVVARLSQWRDLQVSPQHSRPQSEESSKLYR